MADFLGSGQVVKLAKSESGGLPHRKDHLILGLLLLEPFFLAEFGSLVPRGRVCLERFNDFVGACRLRLELLDFACTQLLNL